MIREIDRAAEDGDSIGGAFVVVVRACPSVSVRPPSGTRAWTARWPAAVMAIPAVKAVEIGAGFDVAARRGSAMHDAVLASAPGWDAAQIARAASRAA